ncbi:hypothetical protein KI387_021804, partial [Taxus chinensis]
DEVMRNTKVTNDVMVNELTYLLRFHGDEWYGLHPFGVVFGSSYDPLMALGRMRIDFSDKIQTPLREGPQVMSDL